MVPWIVVSVGAALLLNSGGGSGAFATGQYRNLFLEAGHTQEQATAKIEAAFQQLFHGDPNTQTVYYPAGTNANGPLAYLTDIANNDVRSEGMSYGMMIAVQLNKKAEFDALWNWAKTYMYRDKEGHPGRGYFSWSLNTNGTPRDEMPAPDGEEYFVMSLYFAAHRWGNGTGIYNYHAEADRMLDRYGASGGCHGTDLAPPADGRTDVQRRAGHDSLHAGYQLHGPIVSFAGLLRIVGALGSEGGPGLLREGRCDQPGLLCEGDKSHDRFGSGLLQL